MDARLVAKHGAWKSPITSSMVSASALRLEDQIAVDGEDIYWVEGRPAEGGRSVLVRWSPGGGARDVTAPGHSTRTRVHEYGGGAFAVGPDGVYYANFADQRLYRAEHGGEARAVTPEANQRYADCVVDAGRGRLIGILEDHSARSGEAANSVATIALDGTGAVRSLVSGNDFYASPRLSPDGKQLAWLTWNHPNMPWDAAELWLAGIAADGSLGKGRRIAGGEGQSVCQPRFSPDGTLHFAWEKADWWNLFRWKNGGVEAVCELDAEFGAPAWVFGGSLYAFESPTNIVCAYTRSGTSYLASIDTETGRLSPIETAYTDIRAVQAGPGRAVLLAGSPTEAAAIVTLDLATGEARVVRRATEISVGEGYLSRPTAIEFPTEDGLTAHAIYYPPKNPDFAAAPGERPPLLVFSHGGPTSAASSTLNLSVQYWTSRGFAIADVNYGGSTGYGKAYRHRLDGQWGIVDVDDCVNCARYLVERGEVDGSRTAIRGGSAGGYTTLAALTFRRAFKAGASYYGVSDLEGLARETHKFESRYLDRLIGPYPARSDIYRARSPINFPDLLSCPVIFFQGDEDRVVPPNQAEKMVNALRAKGVPVAYVLFQGEQHGFRKAENIKRALDAELIFYAKIFGFDLPEPVAPLTIDNL